MVQIQDKMKTIISISVFCCLWINIMAQFPQGVKYQAVVRDASGGIITNKSVFFKISILSGTPAGAVVYKENHNDRITNAFGLVNLEIGKGVPELGTFSAIDWSMGSYFVKVEIFPSGASAWQDTGTTQLLSVPYALFARDVQNKDDADADSTNELQSLRLNGTQLVISRSGDTSVSFTHWDSDETDDVKLTGNQTIAGKKTFTDTISASNKTITNVANPVNPQDAATRAYVDMLQTEISKLQNTIVAGGFITDVEGNRYNIVIIGPETWMAENLRTTKFNDGTDIPNVTDNSVWEALTTGAYCWYNNDAAANKNKHGALYNWYAVNTGKLCPEGWHVSKDVERAGLENYLIANGFKDRKSVV